MARSKLHQAAWEALQGTIFTGRKILEEVLVKDLFPLYISMRDRYDIVLPELLLIIELHGIQHYKIATFGADAGTAVMNFKLQQERDQDKREIAILNGWKYIEIPFTDEKLITQQYLFDCYSKIVTEVPVVEEVIPADPTVKEIKQQVRREESLQKAKQYRKDQYKKQKELMNEHRKSSRHSSCSSEEET